MDKCSSDAEFDSYWDYEAKNKNRNRIRVGRQYQATVPPLLKPGEKDGRKSEDLETLKWKPDELTDQEVEQYLSMAKGVGLFANAIDGSRIPEKSDTSLQTAIKGLSEFVASHHPCHHDDGCQVPKPSSSGESSKASAMNDWSPSEAQLFAQALEACGKNFCAIKKEYLPWKPVRSIIEYYYQAKTDKPENVPVESSEVEVKKEEPEPTPCCSHDEMPLQTESKCEKDVKQEPLLTDDSPDDKVLHSEGNVTSECNDSQQMDTAPYSEESTAVSSTVGSLKFFLGGRLVLKLNAQQGSSSGTKCQWVQSNDLPKYTNTARRVKHKKKPASDESHAEAPKQKPCVVKSNCDGDVLIKKPRLKSDYELSEIDERAPPLCSSSWTPPVADGRDSVEMDDCSSKTSEGYISPVLSNSKYMKAESNPCCRGEVDTADSDVCRVSNHSHVDVNSIEDGVPKNAWKNSPKQIIDDPQFKHEVLNHKSALNHSKSHLSSSCYASRVTHPGSPLVKPWSKWSNVLYSERVKPCASPLSSVDSKSPIKDIPLDLSSKLGNSPAHHDACEIPESCHKPLKTEYPDDHFASSQDGVQATGLDLSPKSSSTGSSMHPQNVESDSKNNDSCESVKTNERACATADGCEFSPSNSGDSGALPYSICSAYECGLPKCTKDYPSEGHTCNRKKVEVNQDNSDYVVNETDENLCKRSASWCNRSVASYLQFYPQCYPYYLPYGVTASPSNEASVVEVPLDLSSSDHTKETNDTPENIKDNVNEVNQNNTDAVERGMLYQLLKNKTSK